MSGEAHGQLRGNRTDPGTGDQPCDLGPAHRLADLRFRSTRGPLPGSRPRRVRPGCARSPRMAGRTPHHALTGPSGQSVRMDERGDRSIDELIDSVPWGRLTHAYDFALDAPVMLHARGRCDGARRGLRRLDVLRHHAPGDAVLGDRADPVAPAPHRHGTGRTPEPRGVPQRGCGLRRRHRVGGGGNGGPARFRRRRPWGHLPCTAAPTTTLRGRR